MLFFEPGWTLTLVAFSFAGVLLLGISSLRKQLGAQVRHRQAAENALRASEEKYRQAQKMETLGRLAGAVAHDFNNILNVVREFAEVAIQELDAASLVRQDIEEIRRAAISGLSLTRQLLDFSRKEAVGLRVLDLNERIGHVDKFLRCLAGDDIEFIVRLHDDVGHVKADPGEIEQVIMNLVVNARDAMPDGGTLTIQTGTTGDSVTLAVTDTGMGMTPDVQAQIFQPFFTTKGPEGTGLGLATVHRIVQLAGGRVLVESSPGRGTAFTVHLPKVAAPIATS